MAELGIIAHIIVLFCAGILLTGHTLGEIAGEKAGIFKVLFGTTFHLNT